MASEPTCAGPYLYRTSCSNFAPISGGMQPVRHQRRPGRRWRVEGARQDDLGRLHFGLSSAPTTVLRGSAREPSDLLPTSEVRLPGPDSMCDACDRLGKMAGAMTGESPTSSGRPVNPLYKPPVKRDGPSDGAGKVALTGPLQGWQQIQNSPALGRMKGET